MRKVFSACLMAACGAAIFLVLPMLVGQMVEYRNMDESQAGFVASSYFATYLLSGASAFFWMGRVRLRRAGMLAYGAMTLGVILGAASPGTLALAIAMAVAGAGGGMLYALAVAVISATVEADRNFAWMLVSQQLVAALLLLVVPSTVVPAWGFSGTLLALALLFASLAVSLVWIEDSTAEAESGSDTDTGKVAPVRLALSALVVHFAALSAVWAFVERIASEEGLEAAEIGNGLALSMLAGLAGALLVAWLADRIGRRIPLWFAAAGFLLVCFGYSGSLGWLEFTLYTGAFSFVWNFVLAYQMGIISDLDISGRYAVLMPAAQACGAMLGPAAGGVLISGAGYDPLLGIAAVSVMMATFVFSVYATSR